MKYFIFFIFLISSCASNEDKKFVDQVSPKLVETFKIENKKFEKFVVKDNKVEEEVVEHVIEEVEPSVNKSKKAGNKLLKEDKKVVEVKKSNALPEDYPKSLLELDKKSAPVWKNYKPLYRIGETFVLSLNYLGITAGKVRFTTEGGLKVGGKDALHFRALFKTSKFYKYIYEADDMVETYVSADTFLPIKYSLVQRESNKDVDDLQLFDHEDRKTYLFYRRLKKKNNQVNQREKEAYTTKYFQDFMSTLFFVRGLPLKKGDVYQFPVFTRGKFWRLHLKVVSTKSQVKVMGKWRNAIQIDALARPPKSDKKKENSTISFWYSNDKDRIFLKLQAKLKFGSIEGEIEEHLPGRLP